MKLYLLKLRVVTNVKPAEIIDVGAFLSYGRAKQYVYTAYLNRPFYNAGNPAKFKWDFDQHDATNTLWYGQYMFNYFITEITIKD